MTTFILNKKTNRKNKQQNATRNIKNWADSTKYEHFEIK